LAFGFTNFSVSGFDTGSVSGMYWVGVRRAQVNVSVAKKRIECLSIFQLENVELERELFSQNNLMSCSTGLQLTLPQTNSCTVGGQSLIFPLLY